MEQLKSIEKQLVDAVTNQLNDLPNVHTKELGEVIDMIKDLEKAMYYCSIVKAMEKSEYYNYSTMKDTLDRSSQSRHMYMVGREHHADQELSIKELEHYIKDLGEDLTDMMKDSSQEEKQVLSSRLQQLATKIIK